jgi:uncharacterized alpha-E superfamily protein
MLSRVAEALFWVGRYVERAEDTARLLDVHFHEVLEDPGVDEARACAVLLAVMGGATLPTSTATPEPSWSCSATTRTPQARLSAHCPPPGRTPAAPERLSPRMSGNA